MKHPQAHSLEGPPAPGTPSIRVAVVEDDSSVRGILSSWILQAEGMTCVGGCGDAETAIQELPKLTPHVALVDINLPGANGIVCVHRLKPLLPLTQFVMLTVYEDADHVFDALAAGATGYLVKRTPRDVLIKALREVNGGGSPMSTNIARKVVQFLQKPQDNVDAAEGLSPRVTEVLALLARGYMYKESSENIGISLPTVSTYIRSIYEKLHVRSRAQAVALYTHNPTDRIHRK